MQALSHWVTQIILIIMFAMILELLLPHDRFNRYVKTVIGLILILILLTPIMSLFKMPVDSILNQFNPPTGSDSIKNSINQQKVDIESGQRAYISKQMAVQMKSFVKGELSNRYGLVIQNLDLQLDPANPNVPIQHVNVTVEKTGSPSQTASSTDSKPVTIDSVETIKVASVTVTPKEKSQQTTTTDPFPNAAAVKSFLSNQWNLPVNKITLQLKGGDS